MVKKSTIEEAVVRFPSGEGCLVCGQAFSVEQVVTARSRGVEPRYCSPRCRRRAARRRAVAKARG